MLDKEDKDFSGVLSTAKTALTLYSDPLVARNTSASDFTINDLVNHEHPASLYLVVPPSDKIRLRPLIRLIFTMIVNPSQRSMDFAGAAEKKPVPPVLHGRRVSIAEAHGSLRRRALLHGGYGLKAYLITQDIRQIVDEYGPNESIVSNCHVRIAYAPNQYDTAELLSKMTGTKTVQKATFNFSGSRLAPIANHMSATVDQVERPLGHARRGDAPTTAYKERTRCRRTHRGAGDMLIFVSGHYPIYGTADPLLHRSRSDSQACPTPRPHRISWPLKMATSSHSAGQIAHAMRSALQNRDNRLISSGPAPATARSPMEEAFWKEMGDDHVATDLPEFAGIGGIHRATRPRSARVRDLAKPTKGVEKKKMQKNRIELAGYLGGKPSVALSSFGNAGCERSDC